jgi:hypothetical protein
MSPQLPVLTARPPLWLAFLLWLLPLAAAAHPGHDAAAKLSAATEAERVLPPSAPQAVSRAPVVASAPCGGDGGASCGCHLRPAWRSHDLPPAAGAVPGSLRPGRSLAAVEPSRIPLLGASASSFLPRAPPR